MIGWLRRWWARWMRPTSPSNGHGQALDLSRRQVERAQDEARRALDEAREQAPVVREISRRLREFREDEFAEQWLRSMGGGPR